MPNDLKGEIAESLTLMLLSYAAHGLSTGTLSGLGEISLRDALVVGAAAVGARRKEAWIIKREHKPVNWGKGNLDLLLARKQNNKKRQFCAVELKWWRKDGDTNATNRRTDLMEDFIRAGAMHGILTGSDKMAIVLLLSTEDSWNATIEKHKQGDVKMCELWRKSYMAQKWNIVSMKNCPSIRAAVKRLHEMNVPVANILHSKLLYFAEITGLKKAKVTARCWKIWKPQNTHILEENELSF